MAEAEPPPHPPPHPGLMGWGAGADGGFRCDIGIRECAKVPWLTSKLRIWDMGWFSLVGWVRALFEPGMAES